MDPDQTALRGTVSSGSTLFAKLLLKSQADDTADDNCCYLQFKGKDTLLGKIAVKIVESSVFPF